MKTKYLHYTKNGKTKAIPIDPQVHKYFTTHIKVLDHKLRAYYKAIKEFEKSTAKHIRQQQFDHIFKHRIEQLDKNLFHKVLHEVIDIMEGQNYVSR